MAIITNKTLSEKMNFPLSSVRRWTKEFLTPDKLATRQSGVTRLLSPEQGFLVVLGGHLVSTLGYSTVDARHILKDLAPWVREVLFLHGSKEGSADGIDSRLTGFSIGIEKFGENAFSYAVQGQEKRGMLSFEKIEDPKRGTCQKIRQPSIVTYHLKPRPLHDYSLTPTLDSKALRIWDLFQSYKKAFGLGE